VGDALSRGLSTRLLSLSEVRQLREALGRKGRNGVGIVREILEERGSVSGAEDSILEKRLVDLVRRADLPLPQLQHEVWEAGRFVARIDAAYPERKLAIEVDGYEHHTTPGAFQRDRTRQNRLVALGWTVLRFTWEDVVQRPDMVAEAIKQAIDRTPAA
jgi:very-short-patch-repair endonuclease